ncbi:MAG TPA: ribosomal protein S18-alanine N-acetyltransferase [Methanomassiliicoccales archaeon]|nr:ribosomal protein S18-alanine N-acetyltransferase [Methanomassiliicoccales archaeon]
MQLRRFKPSDLPRVYELACSSLSENYNPTLFVDLHTYWPEGFIVLEHEGVILGFVFGILLSRMDARILMLAVDAKMRGRGLGTVLYREFQRECALKGIRNITLEVRVSNVIAIHFYEKLGFQMTGRVPMYYSNGEDAFRMDLHS